MPEWSRCQPSRHTCSPPSGRISRRWLLYASMMPSCILPSPAQHSTRTQRASVCEGGGKQCVASSTGASAWTHPPRRHSKNECSGRCFGLATSRAQPHGLVAPMSACMKARQCTCSCTPSLALLTASRMMFWSKKKLSMRCAGTRQSPGCSGKSKSMNRKNSSGTCRKNAHGVAEACELRLCRTRVSTMNG